MNTVVLNEVFPKSIYGNTPEVVNSVSIVLNETKQNYLLSLNSTQALSIDTSQLSNKSDIYEMTFDLQIISAGQYVINFAGCNIQQMEFKKGDSKLKFTKAPSDANWKIEIINYGGVAPELSLLDWNLRQEFCLAAETGTTYESPIFRWFGDIDGINTGNVAKYYSDSAIDYYTFSMNPFTLTEFSVHYGTSQSTQYQTSITIYGSDDFENWTEIFNAQGILFETNTTPHFTPHTIRPFKHFKFRLANDGNSALVFEPMTLKGVSSELLYSGYMLRFPNISAALNGYDVAINTEDGCANADNKTPYGAVNGNFISVTRPNQSTTWKVTYTYPEAVRPCCFFMQKWGSYTDTFPAWFAWYGSDDGTTWTKAIELRNILPVNTSHNNFFIYYPCDFGSSHKYWQFRCYATYSNPDKMALASLIPITPYYQYSSFESIVPQLSSNEQEGYIVTASSTTDGEPFKMYDRNNSTYCGGSITDGAWTTTINMGNPVIIRGVQMRTSSNTDRMPTVFKIQGSSDGVSWTDLSTQTLGNTFWTHLTNSATIGNFEFPNDTSYQYYRLYVTATAQGTYVRICELGWTTKIRGNPIDYYTEEYVVPIMNSDSQDGYIASASSYSPNRNPYHAFDRNTEAAYKWITLAGEPVNGSWVKIELPSATAVNVFGIQAPNENDYTSRVPTTFKIQGSNDNVNWTDLVSVSGISWTKGNEIKTWNNTQPTTEYKYYKIDISANGGDSYVAIGTWYLMNRTYYDNAPLFVPPEVITVTDTTGTQINMTCSVPVLTSNNTDGYIASERMSPENSWTNMAITPTNAWNAFDRDNYTFFTSKPAYYYSGGLTYNTTVLRIVCNNSIRNIPGNIIHLLFTQYYFPVKFTIRGTDGSSSNYSEWTTVYTATNNSKMELVIELDRIYNFYEWEIRVTNISTNSHIEVRRFDIGIKNS